MIRCKKYLTPGNLLLFFIFSLGVFFRFYHLGEWFLYTHDQDLMAWFIKDVLVDGHLRLIGQETSTKGIFIGPLFYYLQIPFFYLYKMDPLGQALMSSLIGVFGMISSYFVMTKVYDKKTGTIAMFLYAVSFFVVYSDRRAVPTVPVIIWSIWFFYALILILKNKQKTAFILLGILLGLVWHLNMTLVILCPLILLAFLFGKEKINWRYLSVSVLIFVVLSAPLILFEIRHNFIQTSFFLRSLTSSQGDVYSGWDKFSRVLYVLNTNVTGFITINKFIEPDYLSGLVIVILLFLYGLRKNILPRKQWVILVAWFLLYVGFFSLYSKEVSEYYFDGLFAAYFVLSARVMASKKDNFGKILVLVLLGIYLWMNVSIYVNYVFPGNGYIERKSLVKAIKEDSVKNRYPCVSVTFITAPGYDLGYRYFFYLEELKISSNRTDVPVYTIIFPLGRDSVKEDRRFGNIGLIYPDFSKYSRETVNEECKKGDYNIIEPMFGFTK